MGREYTLSDWKSKSLIDEKFLRALIALGSRLSAILAFLPFMSLFQFFVVLHHSAEVYVGLLQFFGLGGLFLFELFSAYKSDKQAKVR